MSKGEAGPTWVGDDCGWFELDHYSLEWRLRDAPQQQQGSHSFDPAEGAAPPVVRQPIGFMRHKPIVRVKARTAPRR